MKISQNKADTLAVGISLVCSVHCLAMPLLVATLPILSGLFFAEESFHLWMIFAVLPISVYALFQGRATHSKNMPLLVGGMGLLVLIFAAFMGHDLLGETGEKAWTVTGSIAVAIGHIWNHKIRQGSMA